MKKVIVVTSSPRKGGNSEVLAQQFVEGAKAAGNDVRLIAVRDIGLQFCTGCMVCQTHKKCVLGDKMNELYDAFQNADVLVFATPIYYYAVSGQLKTLLDRLNPLYTRENKFKEVYLLTTAADDADSAADGAVKDIQGWIDCFEGVALGGVLRGMGVTEKGEINNTDYPQKAYEMGKSIIG
ncbi:MAG: flavodoxin family protein [Clostridiales bacterium]|nr:flavodoxin family protein [Clostridiales bacterium]